MKDRSLPPHLETPLWDFGIWTLEVCRSYTYVMIFLTNFPENKVDLYLDQNKISLKISQNFLNFTLKWLLFIKLYLGWVHIISINCIILFSSECLSCFPIAGGGPITSIICYDDLRLVALSTFINAIWFCLWIFITYEFPLINE